MNKNFSKVIAATVATSAIVAPISSVSAAESTQTIQSGFYYAGANGEAGKYFTTTEFQNLDPQEKLNYVKNSDKLVVYLSGLGVAKISEVITSGTAAKAFEANGSLNTKTPEKFFTGEFKGTDGKTVVVGEATPPVVGEVKVESVSAITTTTVDVAITAPEKDVLGATVEVKDGKGNAVEVNPVDISAGDKVASFTFKTAVKAEDLTGVWTVDGKAYSFDAIKQLTDITDAAKASPLDQVKLLSALNAGSIKNVDENKLAAYATAIKDAAPETLADVQTAIDEANKTAAEKVEEAKAVKAVVDAENQIQLLNALKANFKFVNSDWNVDYAAATVATTSNGSVALSALTEANSAGVTYKAIQDAINGVNDTNVAAAYDKAFKSLKATDVTAARTLANTYLTDDKDAKVTSTEWANDSLDILDALIRVNTATTNNSLKNALVAIDELETKLVKKYNNVTVKGQSITLTDEFNLKTVNDDLLAAYRDEIEKTTDVTKKNQRKDIQAIVTKVNANAEKALVTAVDTAAAGTDADALLKSLQALGFENVSADNKAQYLADKAAFASAADDTDVSGSKTAIQAQINKSNVTAVDTAATGTDADALLKSLQALGLENVKADNKAQYLADKAAFASAADPTQVSSSLTALQNQVNTSNGSVNTTATIKAVNEATTATEARAALAPVALATAASTDYLNLTATAKLEVAEKFLALEDSARTGLDGDKNYTSIANIKTDLETVTSAYEALLDGVNDANTIAATNTALDAIDYKAFEDLSPAKKLNVAEAFLANFPTDKEGVKVAYTTLAGVKADIDKAITAVAE